ncbi:MAG: hypothetical protein ACKO16_16535 [Gemmataceae bacterium]
MKRIYGSILTLATLSGCVTTENNGGSFMAARHAEQNPANRDTIGRGAYTAQSIPGVQGPWGAPVPVAGPYKATPISGEAAAKAMIASSVPLSMVQQTGFKPGMLPASQNPVQQAMAGMPAGAMLPGGMIAPPGIPAMPGMPGGMPRNPTMAGNNNSGLMLVNHGMPMGAHGGLLGGPPSTMPGAVNAMGALTGGGAPTAPIPVQRTEVRFIEPAGMKISWFAPGSDGKPGFNSQYLESPGRYNFLQAAIYRLKLSEIPNRPGVELYPTLEVVPSTGKTNTFLAHSSVPVSFTEEDFQQVAAGNFVVKVVYLPDPQFQDLATAGGLDEVVSSRLEPGVDPIAEAQRRGSILLIVRLGNIDLEAPNTPAMDAPPGGGLRGPVPPHSMMQGGPGMGRMVPYGISGPSMPGQQGMQMIPNMQMIPGAPGAMPGQQGMQMMPPGAPVTLPNLPATAPKTLPTPTGVPSTSIKEIPGASKVQGSDEETTIIIKKESIPQTNSIPPTGLEVVPGNNGITTKIPEIKSGVPQSVIPPFINK